MRLSDRIHKLAEKIEKGETAADIGTDHGYVPMLLVRNGSSSKVIMSDISESSLAKAKETFAICNINASEDSFRVGDGLETIDNAEVDSVIIGGLGGLTIIDILSNDIEKSKSFKKLVLQPRKHSGELRYYLYTYGWDIVDEDLAREGKFVCEIITAVPTEFSIRNSEISKEDIRWKYPADIVKANPLLARDKIEWKIGSIYEQIENLSNAESDKNELIESLKSDTKYLEELIAHIH